MKRIKKDDENVITTKVGIHTNDIALDSCFHGNDGLLTQTTFTDTDFRMNKVNAASFEAEKGGEGSAISCRMSQEIGRYKS